MEADSQEPGSKFPIYRGRVTPRIRLTVYLVLTARRWRALLDERLRPVGQTAPRMEALSAIINTPQPASQVDVAKRLRIEGPTVTRMIDTLEREELVERRRQPGDRRTRLLSLTTKGEAALEQVFAIIDPLRERLLEDLSDEDVDALTAILVKLLAKLDAGLPEPSETDQ